MKTLDILSFGAGTQSTALLIMAINGELEGYNVKHAVFSDTGNEPPRVKRHLEFMSKYAKERGITVEVVRNGNIAHDIERWMKTGKRMPSLPLFTKDRETGKKAIIRRQCTFDYKIKPIRVYAKKLLGIKKGQRMPKDTHVRFIMGISIDEFQRMKPAPEKWAEHCYPLVDKELDRQWCIEYVKKHIGYKPPSSECIICPFHNDEYWRNMKLNFPDEFEYAVKVDEQLRQSDFLKNKFDGDLYLHRLCKPLKDINFNENQTTLELFMNECWGGCGV